LLFSVPPINLFKPSDRPLLPEPLPGVRFQFMIADESSYYAKAFQENFEGCHDQFCPSPERGVNVLRIYQDKQNLIAALKGVDAQSSIGQYLQKFNMVAENNKTGIYVPSGKFSVPYNLMFSGRYYFSHNLILACYIQALSMELKNVRWTPITEYKENLQENSSNFDVTSIKNTNIYEIAKKYGNLDIGDWKRSGFGDFYIQGIWMADFPQDRPLIKNVRPQLRLALEMPSGKRTNIDKILALPFGNNGAWATMVSGGLDVFFTNNVKGGLDVEFLFPFGHKQEARIKTNCDQTDLLNFKRELIYKAQGYNQQINLYLVARWRALQFKVDYQYLKNEEDKEYIYNNKIDPNIANSKESLQDWSTHSFILSLRYYFDDHINISFYKPAIFGFLKLGFNGKRAVLLNTLGLTLMSNF